MEMSGVDGEELSGVRAGETFCFSGAASAPLAAAQEASLSDMLPNVSVHTWKERGGKKRHCINSGNKQNDLLVALDSSGNARYWFVVNSLVHFSPHHVSVDLSTESVNFTCEFNFFV